MQTCLIITYGPIPTNEYKKVDGGAMRVHGLATGLIQNGVDVTVAIHANFPQTDTISDGIKLVNWQQDSEFIKLFNSFDSVLMSYQLGDYSKFVRDNIGDDVQLILDAYVPAYIEVAARNSTNIKSEYSNYFIDLPRWNWILGRGDYFLTASNAQNLLYTGALSAIGVINPASYHTKRIIEAPFGIPDTKVDATINPYNDLGVSKSDFTVLWFGGLYPWFRIEEYLNAILELSKDKTMKFVFVGGKNPNNGNPDFEAQYDIAVSFMKQHKLEKSVHFVEWVDYSSRGEWYVHADVIVSLNQPAEENKYAWRTRVMDFVWGEAAIITNGGDPLSEELINEKAAVRLPELSTVSIVEILRNLRENPKSLEQVRKNIQRIQPRYFWKTITAEVSNIIKAHTLPFSDESPLRKHLADREAAVGVVSKTPIWKVLKLGKKTLRYAKSKGIKRTAGAALKTTRRRLQIESPAHRSEPQFVFISHPIDNTGAPIVFMNIIEEYVEKYGSNRVRVIAISVNENNAQALKKLGITVEKAIDGVSLRVIRLQLGLRPNDFVFINTSAIYRNYLQFVFVWLKLGRLKHAYWFIHEDLDQCKELIVPSSRQIKELTENNKLTIFFPSRQTMTAFSKILGEKSLVAMTMRSDVASKLKIPRHTKDFDTLRFLISGTTTDGRKGQLIAIAAFQHFLDTHYAIDPSSYRDFQLTLLSVATDDYPSQQVRIIGESALKGHVKIYKNMERHKALDIAHQSNVVICCSLHETYALYVAENMLMGSIVLRNDVGGVDEQLRDGVNGYAINSKNVVEFSLILEKMLNKSKTTNEDLQKMSIASQLIAKNFSDASYLEQITEA